MYFEGSRGSFLYIKPVASSKDPQEFRFHKHQGPDNNVACYMYTTNERVVQGLVHFVHIFLVKLCLHVFSNKKPPNPTLQNLTC